MKKQSGLTLIELMIVLVLMGILAGIAVPNFTSMVASNRVVTTHNQLVSALNLARSEAIKRSANIRVTGAGAVNGIGGNWNDGWLVEIDVDGGEVIRQYPAPSGGITITVASGPNPPIFSGMRITGAANTRFEINDGSGNSTLVRCITITNTGRVNSEDVPCS